jgi:hypothetical protein
MVNGKPGKIIGINGPNNTYQIMIGGITNFYTSKSISKLSKPKKNKKGIKRKKKIKQKNLFKIKNN